MKYAQLIEAVEAYAPTKYAYGWDNVGTLLYSHDDVERVLVCLDICEQTLAEAQAGGFDTIVSYHPLLFKPQKQLRKDEHNGAMLIKASALGLNLYALHTAYDALPNGMNFALGNILKLADINPLVIEAQEDRAIVAIAGVVGNLQEAVTLEAFAAILKEKIKTPCVKLSGKGKEKVQKIACVCGSGAEYLHNAVASGADVLLTGEAKHSDYYEAEACGLWLIEIGHYDSERHAVQEICQGLQKKLNTLQYDITIHGSVDGVRPYCVL